LAERRTIINDETDGRRAARPAETMESTTAAPTGGARAAAPAPRPPAPGRRRRARLLAHEVGALGRVAGPVIASQVGGTLLSTVDTLMVGPLGATSLAAAGLSGSLQFALLTMALGVLMGATPLVSHAFGAGQREETRRVLVQGVWLAVALALPVTALSFFGEEVANALGQAPEVATLTGRFLGALGWGVLPFLLFTACRQYLEGMGRTKPAMVISWLGVAVNVAGNAALIYGVRGVVPAMGAVGAAWATSIVRWSQLLAMVAYLVADPAVNPFRGVRWVFHGPRMARILALGLPVALQLGAEVGIFSFAAVMMGWVGPAALAAHQVTINVAATTFMVALGCSLAGSIRVGLHVGARDARGMRRAAAATYLLVLSFMSLTALAFFLAPRAILGLYTSDPEILSIGVGLLFWAAIFQLFDGAQVAGLHTLRGAADTRVAMTVTLIGYWGVGLPVAYFAGFRTGLGPAGIWIGLSASLAVVAVLLAVRVRTVLWLRPPPVPRLHPTAH
jgi:MATE family multidrug resistance protein